MSIKEKILSFFGYKHVGEKIDSAILITSKMPDEAPPSNAGVILTTKRPEKSPLAL